MKNFKFLTSLLILMAFFISCKSVKTESANKQALIEVVDSSNTKDEAYYEKDGGAEFSIRIENPSVDAKSSGINAKAFRETITNDFSTFSAMTIVDIASKEKIINNFENNLDNVVEGLASDESVTQVNFLSANYTVITEIEYIKELYNISSHITDNRDGTLKGTFTGKFNKTEIDNDSAANTVAKTLLKRMGIKLTPTGQKEFKAQEDAAKINTAEKTDNVVSKMGYYNMAISTEKNKEISDKLQALRTNNKIDWASYYFNLIDFMELNYPLFTYKEAPSIKRNRDGTFKIEYYISVFPNFSTVDTYFDFKEKVLEKSTDWVDYSFYPEYKITFGFYNKNDKKLGSSVWSYNTKETILTSKPKKSTYYSEHVVEYMEPVFDTLNRSDCQGTYIQVDKLEVKDGKIGYREISPIQLITEDEYDVLY